mmetsp:Transcript_30898/g.81236  ORF Transcript_30898/g.81236 Transcript_30898/m.81236 type:complete len:105 (+) Transcript_30898:101-415(+)
MWTTCVLTRSGAIGDPEVVGMLVTSEAVTTAPQQDLRPIIGENPTLLAHSVRSKVLLVKRELHASLWEGRVAVDLALPCELDTYLRRSAKKDSYMVFWMLRLQL